MAARTFSAVASAGRGGGIIIAIPFDPHGAWGRKDRHYVTGTVDGRKVRGSLALIDGAYLLTLGPAWQRDCGVTPGSRVKVVLEPEGPQHATLASDFAEALESEPGARGFFESLATFYRKGYTRWIEEAKRPETRAKRIAETVAALKSGKKQR